MVAVVAVEEVVEEKVLSLPPCLKTGACVCVCARAGDSVLDKLGRAFAAKMACAQ